MPSRDGAVALSRRCKASARPRLRAPRARAPRADRRRGPRTRPSRGRRASGSALLARRRRRRPLLLDIDDWEVGFFSRSGAWGRVGRALNLANPNGLTWTWLAEQLVGRADAITVASRFLERRFGRTSCPTCGTPRLGIPPATIAPRRGSPAPATGKVVMFLGHSARATRASTTSIERGRLAGARRSCWRSSASTRRRGGAPRWSRTPHVKVTRRDPVRRRAALPRRGRRRRRAPARDHGHGGAGAGELFDAMALARPIVSTSVSMIPEILDGCGLVVEPGNVPALASAIRRLLDDPAEAAALGPPRSRALRGPLQLPRRAGHALPAHRAPDRGLSRMRAARESE